MTKVLLVCGKGGVFSSCRAEGHASFARKGHDIVCAAESFMLRTAVDVLENTGGLDLQTDFSRRGFAEFSVSCCRGSEDDSLLAERLRCVADFIRCGMESLVAEYPGNVYFQEIVEEGCSNSFDAASLK